MGNRKITSNPLTLTCRREKNPLGPDSPITEVAAKFEGMVSMGPTKTVGVAGGSGLPVLAIGDQRQTTETGEGNMLTSQPLPKRSTAGMAPSSTLVPVQPKLA